MLMVHCCDQRRANLRATGQQTLAGQAQSDSTSKKKNRRDESKEHRRLAQGRRSWRRGSRQARACCIADGRRRLAAVVVLVFLLRGQRLVEVKRKARGQRAGDLGRYVPLGSGAAHQNQNKGGWPVIRATSMSARTEVNYREFHIELRSQEPRGVWPHSSSAAAAAPRPRRYRQLAIAPAEHSLKARAQRPVQPVVLQLL